jgi:hypothetical protein
MLPGLEQVYQEIGGNMQHPSGESNFRSLDIGHHASPHELLTQDRASITPSVLLQALLE